MVRRKESSRVCTRPLCGPPLSLRVQLSSAPAWPFLGVAPPRIPNWLCHSRQPHEATVATIDPQTRTAVVGASQAPESSPFLLPLHRQSLGSLSHSAIALGGFFFFFFSSSIFFVSLSVSWTTFLYSSFILFSARLSAIQLHHSRLLSFSTFLHGAATRFLAPNFRLFFFVL